MFCFSETGCQVARRATNKQTNKNHKNKTKQNQIHSVANSWSSSLHLPSGRVSEVLCLSQLLPLSLLFCLQGSLYFCLSHVTKNDPNQPRILRPLPPLKSCPPHATRRHWGAHSPGITSPLCLKAPHVRGVTLNTVDGAGSYMCRVRSHSVPLKGDRERTLLCMVR